MSVYSCTAGLYRWCLDGIGVVHSDLEFGCNTCVAIWHE
jgi:hypothetical protein